MSAEAQRDAAEEKSEEARKRRAAQRCHGELQPGRQGRRPGHGRAEVPERIGSDAEEAGLPDGNLGHVPEQNRESDCRDGVDGGIRAGLKQGRVRVREQPEKHDRRCEDRQQARVGAQSPAQSRTAARAPKSPCGRIRSTASNNE